MSLLRPRYVCFAAVMTAACDTGPLTAVDVIILIGLQAPSPLGVERTEEIVSAVPAEAAARRRLSRAISSLVRSIGPGISFADTIQCIICRQVS